MNICVFGSAKEFNSSIMAEARKLGRLIGSMGYGLTYGGFGEGLLSEVAKGVKEYGGYITAVAPQTPRLNNPLFQEIDELILSDDKRKRKELQEKNSDMFVVLPTGIGVLDELFEILVLKSYGELKQRIVIVNIENMYDNLKVLKDVNLHVAKGEIYGLIGKNGAGKTTIFKIILGLTEFESGTLCIAGSKKKTELPQKRKKIGFFIGNNFYDYLTAEENLHYYRQLKDIKDKEEVKRVLNLVGLEGVTSKYGSFSMGMKQRLGIANALLGSPEILLLDEPINGLDPQGIADIRTLIVSLNRKQNMTIIVSSHILGELEHTANKFGFVHQGTVLKEITHDDLKVKRSAVQIYVGDLEKARSVLKQNNIPVLQESSAYKSLEDYYFDLVGGKRCE